MGPLRAVPSRRGALFPPGSLGPVSPVLDPSGDRIATVEGAVAEFTWDEAEFERVARKYGITKLVVGYTLLGGGNVALDGGRAHRDRRAHRTFPLRPRSCLCLVRPLVLASHAEKELEKAPREGRT